ncbi:MAG: transketolase [Planctomycetes bacterium]|nr:transketolase [Planctomycetota bacterium]
MINYRKEVINMLVRYFRQDSRYYLLVGDMGFGAIDRLKEEFPRRVINCGIMEQGTTGIAAGMSMSGLIPIFYSIVNFLVFRSLEQIRNDIVTQHLNVKLIGTGANDYFEFLGPSHCCGGDDIKIMQLIDMDVYDPYAGGDELADGKSEEEFFNLIDRWLSSDRCGYLRV